mmetsp:Transcript_10259/g.13472  ORF Transcript_10259/g.13472 Transcript_10259/m.13472 type:complete len:334 (-) Transcript_10259:238-1239(-)
MKVYLYLSLASLIQWQILAYSVVSQTHRRLGLRVSKYSTNSYRKSGIFAATKIQETDPQIQKASEALIKFCDQGEWAKSLVLLKMVRQKCIVPTADAYNAIIAACFKTRQLERADAVFRDWQSTFLLDPISHLAASSMVEESASPLEQALAIVKAMNKKHVKPSQDTVSLLLAHCEQSEDWHLAMQIFSWAKKQDVPMEESVAFQLLDLLFSQNKQEIALMMYDALLLEGVINHPLKAKEFCLDLSGKSLLAAKCILNVAVSDISNNTLQNNPTGREMIDVRKTLTIKMEEGTDLQEQVLNFLSKEKGIKAVKSKTSPGCIEIKPLYLKKLLH